MLARSTGIAVANIARTSAVPMVRCYMLVLMSSMGLFGSHRGGRDGFGKDDGANRNRLAAAFLPSLLPRARTLRPRLVCRY